MFRCEFDRFRSLRTLLPADRQLAVRECAESHHNPVTTISSRDRNAPIINVQTHCAARRGSRVRAACRRTSAAGRLSGCRVAVTDPLRSTPRTGGKMASPRCGTRVEPTHSWPRTSGRRSRARSWASTSAPSARDGTWADLKDAPGTSTPDAPPARSLCRSLSSSTSSQPAPAPAGGVGRPGARRAGPR